MKHLLPLILIIILFSSCINPDNSEKHEYKSQTKFYSVNKGIELLVSPSESSQKLVNEKASSITKDTEYCKLDNSNKLIVIDIKGSWSKVKVIEPEWLTDTYIGWIPSSNLVEFGSAVTKIKIVPSRIDSFNDISNIINKLSQNGIRALHSWRSDDAGGFMSITDYFRFGEVSSENGLNNNLAYYLESNNEQYAQKLTTVLNIFNKNDRKNAIKRFGTLIQKTFKSIALSEPKGLVKATDFPETYEFNNEQLRVKLEKEKNNIETWKLTITSK